MSREIFLPRPEVEKLFLTSSPCPLCEALGSAFFLSFSVVLRCSISGASSSFSSDDADRVLKLCKRAVVRCQPWIYLRLNGPSAFSGCPRRHRDFAEAKCHRHLCAYRRYGCSFSNPSVSRTDWPPPDKDQRRWKGLFTRDAQAACDFSFSASKFSPFFQSVSVMAAILRASVRRTIVGLMPLASDLW
jgi:hypothetical protein